MMDIDRLDIPEGWYVFREHFLWGNYPGIKEIAEPHRIRFLSYDGKWLNPGAKLRELLDQWHPVAREEYDYASVHMVPELNKLQTRELPCPTWAECRAAWDADPELGGQHTR